jgi:asparagine synthase (glutamine-hydrolysing)
MCGIAGIVNFTSEPEDLHKRTAIMQSLLAHRGPDEKGIKSYPNISIAHSRLALIDIKGGKQPFCSHDDRYVISYNGEVYNYKSLKRELEDRWVFTSDSDTEVVLAAYAVLGKKCVLRFNGMFSFFIWDSVKNEGFAARDLLGVKPFVYKNSVEEFVFSSEAKAIVGIDSSPPVANFEAIVEYIVCPYFSGVEQPMFRDLEYLLPGHYLYINKSGLEQHQWGDVSLSDDVIDSASNREELSNLIVDGIKSAMTSDVPICTYLSGGFDSTLITSIANGVTNGQLDTYTIRFQNQNAYDYKDSLIISSDDTPYASLAAKDIGVINHIVDVTHKDLEESLREIAICNDALPAWEQEIAQHHLAKRASRDYKVVLVGDAADETHYGYQFLLDSQATNSPSGIINRFSLPLLKKGILDNPLEYFDEKYKNLTINSGHTWDSPTNRYLATTYLIIKRWLPRLLHNGDIHAMQHSLEARVPFADIHLLRFAQKVAPSTGYNNGVEKWLLRKSCKGLLPETSRERRKSALPKDQRVDNIYKAIGVGLFITYKEFLSNFIDIKNILQLCRTDYNLSEQEKSLLFRLISLCYWKEEYGVIIK